MNSVFGERIKISLFGESHQKYIGLTIHNFPAGIVLDYEKINRALEKRRPKGKISTPRVEDDKYEFISGIFNDTTTGAPLTVIIENSNVVSKAYNKGKARPSHVDLVAHEKFNGFEDYRGSGHFSGRITAPLVILGALCEQLLNKKGIIVTSHIYSINDIFDDELNFNDPKQIETLLNKDFPVLNENKGKNMISRIEDTAKDGDSVGGIVESVILNLPVGLGEPFFDSLESIISHLMFSIGGVKGVLFGAGINFASAKGSEINDSIRYKDDKVVYQTNNNGGIVGGISNSAPVVFKSIIRPTPSISKTQESIDFLTKENVTLKIHGRHDPCIVHRVREVIDALSKYAIVEMLYRM